MPNDYVATVGACVGRRKCRSHVAPPDIVSTISWRSTGCASKLLIFSMRALWIVSAPCMHVMNASRWLLIIMSRLLRIWKLHSSMPCRAIVSVCTITRTAFKTASVKTRRCVHVVGIWAGCRVPTQVLQKWVCSCLPRTHPICFNVQ